MCADLWCLDEVGEFVGLFSGVVSTTFSHDASDVGSRIEDAELAFVFQQFGDFLNFHSEAEVGFVGTIFLHRLLPGHAQEGLFAEVHAAHFLEQVFCHLFEGLKDVFLFHEGHFAVNLREFRLAVCAQVFIAEAFGDLEISVNACHHEELLEGLRALGQGIELSLVHSGGHDEVSCAFGC